ncbi:hypothetical protein B382_21186 [Stutzerimonas stutzeri B1SMN1]|nr:hypothetical protein B382_21186 [Stutzerimonas stutzeri B1SMN1]
MSWGSGDSGADNGGGLGRIGRYSSGNDGGSSLRVGRSNAGYHCRKCFTFGGGNSLCLCFGQGDTGSLNRCQRGLIGERLARCECDGQ